MPSVHFDPVRHDLEELQRESVIRQGIIKSDINELHQAINEERWQDATRWTTVIAHLIQAEAFYQLWGVRAP